ncbi:MAG: hypothetical protein IKM36_03550 [Oscillospiraceae bacterium]|nr:hypothetical protein [Oscillospiraceae bacterium]MBR3849551.1 hypothetical protein [Oscillospiraceae bacterium]
MNIFVNAFNVATKNDGSEFVLHLCQVMPEIDDDGEITGQTTETVGGFVMSQDFAREIATSILKTLDPTQNQTSSD